MVNENQAQNKIQKPMGESQAKIEQILNGSINMPQPQIKYAGFWIRWVASCIDGLVLSMPSMILGGMFGSTFGILGHISGINNGLVSSISGGFGYISGSIISWMYFILMTYKYVATLGKMVMGIRVISDEKKSLTLGQIVLRETIGKIITTVILFIGFIMAGFTEKKQSLHDIMANTVVVYKDPNKKLNGCVISAVVLVCILPFIAIIGILVTIFLVGLSSARDKAFDATNIVDDVPSAIYQEEENDMEFYKKL